MKTDTTQAKTFPWWLPVGVLLIVVSRLPQMLGPNFLTDGDESILGLMAKHMAEGRACPLFFYGQRYGFSLLEAGTAAGVFLIFGASSAALKGSILLLWAIAWGVFFAVARKLCGRRTALLAGLFLMAMPAWAASSMKARGGYVTAFLLTHVAVLWQLQPGSVSKKRTNLRAAGVGALTGLVFLSQPFWLIALVPFLVLFLGKDRRWSALAVTVSSAVGIAGILSALGSNPSADYWSPSLLQNLDGLSALRQLPHRLWVHFTGAYFYYYRTPIGPWSEVCGVLWCGSLMIAVMASIVGQVARGGVRRDRPRAIEDLDVQSGHFPDHGAPGIGAWILECGAVAAIVLMCALSLCINVDAFAFRYFLPMSSWVVMLVARRLIDLRDMGSAGRWIASAAIAVLVVAGAVSMIEHARLKPNAFTGAPGGEAAPVRNLISELLAANVRFVYCTDPMLQWVLMFESREEIVARWAHPTDRCPQYPPAVDQARRRGERVALVATVFDEERLETLRGQEDHAIPIIRRIDDRYLMLFDPPEMLLTRMGFVLNKVEGLPRNP